MSNKLIYGFGINDVDYPKTRKAAGIIYWRCEVYDTWVNMLQRCYSQKWAKTSPCLETPTCCNEWRYFSKFKLWMEAQEYKGMHLDKDILVVGNREYSPDKCAFVPRYINNIIQTKQASRGEYPLGVRRIEKWRKKQFQSRMARKNLGYFQTPAEAHKAWQLSKSKSLQDAVSLYSKEPYFRTDIAGALIDRSWTLLLDYSMDRETKSL